MAECKPTEKGPEKEVDLTSISNILNLILGAFDLFEKPAKLIPPVLLLVGVRLRPGMSWRNACSRAISEFEEETGVSMGNVYSDGANVNAAKFKHTFKQMHKEITEKMVVQTVIPPGAVQITVATPSGPGQGSNTLPIEGLGGGH